VDAEGEGGVDEASKSEDRDQKAHRQFLL
jgi:hypothetical protein